MNSILIFLTNFFFLLISCIAFNRFLLARFDVPDHTII